MKLLCSTHEAASLFSYSSTNAEKFPKACICTGMIETRHDNLYYSPVTALTVAHHGKSEQESALEEPSVRLTPTSTAMSKHFQL